MKSYIIILANNVAFFSETLHGNDLITLTFFLMYLFYSRHEMYESEDSDIEDEQELVRHKTRVVCKGEKKSIDNNLIHSVTR